MSQPRGSGGSEMSVAQRICAADTAQRAAWASPAARIKLPKEGEMQPGGRDKMRKEDSFLNTPARLRRAGWETRLLIKLSSLRWQRVSFFQKARSTQTRHSFSEHCKLMPAHTPTPPNIFSAHPIKEKAPSGIRTSPKMYLEYKKTQIYALGSILNSEYFCLLTRSELFPGCYQWKRKQIMWRLPEESKTSKQQLEKASTKGLQQINLERFHSSQVCPLIAKEQRLAINRCAVHFFKICGHPWPPIWEQNQSPFCTELPFSSPSQLVKNKPWKKHAENLLVHPHAHTQRYRHTHSPFILDFHCIHCIYCCTFYTIDCRI